MIILSRQADKRYNMVMNALDGLLERPPRGDIVKLKGYVDERRLRVGNIRAVFRIRDGIVHILDIGFRGNVY